MLWLASNCGSAYSDDGGLVSHGGVCLYDLDGFIIYLRMDGWPEVLLLNTKQIIIQLASNVRELIFIGRTNLYRLT